MTRSVLAFAIWASVQLLFVSVFISLLWRLGQLVSMAKREAKTSSFMVNMLTTWAHRWGDDPGATRDELLRHVEQFTKRDPHPTSWVAVLRSWIWRR